MKESAGGAFLYHFIPYEVKCIYIYIYTALAKKVFAAYVKRQFFS